MRILGIDPGLADTGWGVIEIRKSRSRHVGHGTIKTKASQPAGDRLNQIFSGIRDVIQCYKPEAVGIESLYFAKNRQTALPVAQARGVLLLACSIEKIPHFEYTPLQIKQAITGNGRAEKFQVQEMVRLLLGLEAVPKPDHAADALGAAICCYHTRMASIMTNKGE
ncbi:MAG: crossover junction endodeoxyribonuclease RuvC [Spirochaetales bacterium]|nr:crossover junction endodeoxyribonuclease RuvC [Spirochaetales bacterium]